MNRDYKKRLALASAQRRKSVDSDSKQQDRQGIQGSSVAVGGTPEAVKV